MPDDVFSLKNQSFGLADAQSLSDKLLVVNNASSVREGISRKMFHIKKERKKLKGSSPSPHPHPNTHHPLINYSLRASQSDFLHKKNIPLKRLHLLRHPEAALVLLTMNLRPLP